MKGQNIVLSSFVILLVMLGISNHAFAAPTTARFYQDSILIEHTTKLTINDPAFPNASIWANVTSGTGGVATQFIMVNLPRINSTAFQSEFINFTSASTSAQNIKLHVDVGSTVNVKVPATGVPTSFLSATVLRNDLPLDNIYSTSTLYSPPLLLRSVNTPCTNGSFGSDGDNDFICNDWENESQGLIITYPAGQSYTVPCTAGKTYELDDPLGTSVCPKKTEKDMYIEIDYMKGHKPDINALINVTKAFRDPSLGNNKINLHIFVDKEIEHTKEINFPGDTTPGFLHIKVVEFGPGAVVNQNDYISRSQVFQYFIWGHDQQGAVGTSGISDGANDGAVTLGSFVATVAGSRKQQEGTFMHELGHNLGLGHGGTKTDQNNCKPNLISVMNYAYQFGDLVPNPKLDFSRKAIGNNTITPNDSTSLGMESSLSGNLDVEDSIPSSQWIVYGNGAGTLYQQLPEIDSESHPWPTPWSKIRTIQDSKGRVVCSTPPNAVSLSGVDQWPAIKMHHGAAAWTSGRSSDVSPSPTSLSEQYFAPIYKISTPAYTQYLEKSPTLTQYSKTNTTDPSINKEPTKETTDPSINKEPKGTTDKPYGTIEEAAEFEIPSGSWCISLKEAQNQAKKSKILDVELAPLCTDEIKMDNVRAARSANVDNIISAIQSISKDHLPKKSANLLIDDAEKIRTLVLDDKIYESLESYNYLKKSIDGNVTTPAENSYLKGIVDVNTYLLQPVGQLPEFPNGIIDIECDGDDDKDTICNSNDLCPATPTGETINKDGCSSSQLDTDGDGVFDNVDLCPDTPEGETVNKDGCSFNWLWLIVILILIITLIVIVMIFRHNQNSTRKNQPTTITSS